MTGTRESVNTPLPPPEVADGDLRRVISSSVAGSAMEWYDFSIYGTASALVFSDLFFPQFDHTLGLLATFGAYAAGFVARPLGGLFFGRLGDRIGRKAVLVATIVLMGTSTFLIGLLPTYDAIGIWAGVLLLALRLAQGFGSGAEQAGASLIVAEFAPPRSRGFFAALPFAGIIVGILLAGGIWTLLQNLPEDALLSWGWRVPFLLSAVVVLVGLIIRMKVKESPVFEAIRRTGNDTEHPVGKLLRESRRTLVVAFGLRLGENGASYLYQVFALTYIADVLLIDKSVGTLGVTIAAACSLVTIPLVGTLSDRFGRRTLYRVTAAITGLWAFPAFWLMDTGNEVLVVVSLVVAIAIGVFGMYGVQGAYFPELFDAEYRYTGVAVSKEFAALLAGGVAPFIATAMLGAANQASWPISLYILGLACVSFVATFFAPETKGCDMTNPCPPRAAHRPCPDGTTNGNREPTSMPRANTWANDLLRRARWSRQVRQDAEPVVSGVPGRDKVRD